MTLSPIYFFESNAPLPGIFDQLFGGAFLVKGLSLLGELGILALLTVALWNALKAWKRPESAAAFFSVAASLGIFTLISVFLLQPWDELFINLRHAWNFAQGGRFSFQRFEWSEGTVDFLPYLIVGFLAREGVPVLEGGFLLCFISGLVCIYMAARLFGQSKLVPHLPFFVLTLCCFAPLNFNSSHGFATAFFTAAMLASIRYLFFERRCFLGWTCLTALPLIRVEGILLASLLGGLYFYFERPSRQKAIALGFCCLAPTALHAFIRFKVYGFALPLPVQYKSCFGNGFYFSLGLRNLVADLIATHTFCLLLTLKTLRLACQAQKVAFPMDADIPPTFRRMKYILGAIALFVLPYYLSGGDWFPSYWGRYLFPFTLFLFICTAATAAEVGRRIPFPQLMPYLAAPFVFFVISCLWPISSTYKQIETVFSHRRTLAMVEEPTIARGHYRVQHLSKLGELLRRTTLPEDRIGSSELATLMFFAQRDAVDFLGLTNPSIAQAPLRTLPSFFRKFPYRSELPYLIFRRTPGDLLGRYSPEILYTFDFMVRDHLKGVRPYELDNHNVFSALTRWETQLGGLIDSLYGGLENIAKHGYSPIVVKSGMDFAGMYFVQDRILQRHLKALRDQGYRGGILNYTHRAEPSGATSDVQ